MSAGCAGDGRMCLEIIGCPKNGAIRSSNSWSWRNPLSEGRCAPSGVPNAGRTGGWGALPASAAGPGEPRRSPPALLMRPANEDARGSRAEAGAAQVPQGRRPRAICRVNRSMVPWKSPGPVAELVLPRGTRRLRASGGISLLDLCIFAPPGALRRRVAQSPFCSALSPRQGFFFTEGRP